MKRNVLKKKKITLILVLLIGIGLLMTVGVSFARYIGNNIWNYYLSSNGFYFTSSELTGETYIDNTWDRGKVYFDLMNFEDDDITESTIEYTAKCEVITPNDGSLTCSMNGLNSNSYDSEITASGVCTNNTGDGVVTSVFNETECFEKNYDWVNDKSTSNLFFQIMGLNSTVTQADVEVKVTVDTTAPYTKTLSSNFMLHYESPNSQNYTLEHTSYSDYEKVVVTNLGNTIEKFSLQFNSDEVRISEILPSVATSTDINGFVNEVEFTVDPNSNVVIYFYKTSDTVVVDASDFVLTNIENTDPIIVDGVIPVIYDEPTKQWVKVDPATGTWFDYDNQQWANAVTVVNSKRNQYIDADYGSAIPMEDIITFLVWIPRFSYTIRDTYGYQIAGANTPSQETPGAFDIKFVTTAVTDLGTGSYTGNSPTNFHTPAAFCWGNSCDDPTTRDNPENIEIDGFWIAKFEASKKNDLLYSVPNVTPMNNINMANTFSNVQSLMNGQNGYENYGYVGNVDAHLIKNTEWGAIAYLSQSAYGKYGNPDYTGLNKEVYPNNCSTYITGIGGNSPQAGRTTATCYTNTYDTYYGMGASTTGNIYGVYDMVGGTFDRVMGTVLKADGTYDPGQSGFTSIPEGRYINLYPLDDYGVSTTSSIKGDALTETLGFYKDRFIEGEYYANSWLYRGGSLWSTVTEINGVFSYTTFTGQADLHHSSRFTISVW